MKKIFYSIIVAGLALVSAACQKLDEQTVSFGSNDLTVTASIVNFDGTKVSYEFSDHENVKSGIKPSWESSDAIFGFDENGNTFTFPVSSIDDNGKATFDASSATGLSGKLYAVYYPGGHSFDGEGAEKTLSVDLSSQSGKLDGSAPVIMCATGEIKSTAEGNVVNFNFTNQTAIVGIYKMQVFNNGETVGEKAVTGVTLKGATVDGSIKVKDGVLTLVAGSTKVDLTSNVEFTTDAKGNIDVDPDAIAPYFAVIPDAEASLSIEAVCDGSSCKTNASITGNINPGQYYYLGKKVYGGTVATIGTAEYATVSEAFAAANDGDEIQLQNSCIFDSQITLAGKTGTITLDLNGCTLTNGPTLNDKQSRIYLNNEGVTLVIRDSQNGGKILGKASQDVVKVIKGNLTVASGTIEAPSGGTDGGNAAIWVEPATSGATTDASVTIQGTANIQGPASFAQGVTNKRAYALYVDNPGAAISVSGGNFSAQSNSMRIMDAKSVNITGGTFTCETSGEYTLRFAASAGKPYTCSISGNASVSSASSAVYAYGTDDLTLNVSGGKFKTTGTAGIIVRDKPTTAEVYPTISISGGLYSKAPATARLAATYGLCDNTDSETSETYPCKVARPLTLAINGGEAQYFASIEAAVDEANKDDNKALECKIKLLESVTMGSSAKNVSNTAGVTLDLNGNTLTQNGSNRLGVTTGGKLTITDEKEGKLGKITQNSVDSYAIKLENGEMTIAGGTIDCVSGQKYATVYVTGGTLYVQDDAKILSDGKSAVSVDNGGTVNVSGGEILASDAYGIATSATVTVSGGYVTSSGSNTIRATGGKLTINEGYFKSTGTYAVIYGTGTITDYIVNGGFFSKELNTKYVTIKSGYICVSEPDESREDYPFVIKEASAADDVATLTVGSESTNFKSVKEAVDAANEAEQECKITLIESSVVGTSANVTNSYGVTLDLNGCTLTQNGSNRVGVSENGNLTITDTKTGGGGMITQNQNTNVIVVSNANSTLTVAGGKITYPTDVTGFNVATVYVTNGKLNMTGGEVVANRNGISMTNGTVSVSGTAKVTSVDRSAISVTGGALTVSEGEVTSSASGYATIAVSSDSEKGTSGSATVEGGKVSSSANSAISVSGTGNLTVTEGEIETTVNKSGNHAINLDAGNGTVNISGGNIHAVYQAINFAANSKHTVNLSGKCVVTSTNTNAMIGRENSAATVMVTGGKYKSGGGQAIFSTASGASTTYSVKECKFNGPDINANRLAPFYRNAANTDSDSVEYPKKTEYYVPVTLAIGSGDPQPYATIEAAVTAANTNSSSPCTITINDDLKTTAISNVTNGNGVTLDLNNHTLTYAGTYRIRPATGGKLIIRDSGSNGIITNTTATNVMYYTGGELVLQGGTIKPFGTSSGVVYVENAKFTMEGGTITDNNLNVRALTIGGSNTATVNITGGTILGGNVGTVKVDDVYYQTGAIFVNNSNATCTINGADVVVEAPNVESGDYAVRPIVSVVKGAFKLVKGTIGSTDVTTSDNGNMTAVQVYNGTFDMEGGYIYARHHAIIFNGSGAVTISGGRLATTKNGWSLLRFQANVTNTLTISGGGFTVAGSSGKMFAGSSTGTAVPTTATVSITPTCYFDKFPLVNGISNSHITGTLSQDTYTYDGKSYGFKVE